MVIDSSAVLLDVVLAVWGGSTIKLNTSSVGMEYRKAE